MKSTQHKKAVVIGAGFAGLSAATNLASRGFDTTLLEKNDQAGGRARMFESQGFLFDMGPSWYWMPDVFEEYFQRYGHSVAEYYHLVRLSPSYRVFFEDNQTVDLPASMDDLFSLFESIESGSAKKLSKFLDEAEYKYRVGMKEFVHKPGRSLLEYVDRRVFSSLFKLNMLSSFHSYVSTYFRDSRLIRILEFPVLFLGAHPRSIPALYSMMNYADMVLGTWYPLGGMHTIVKAMVSVAEEQGVKINLREEVTGFGIENGRIHKVDTDTNSYEADVVVATADYHHIDQELLPQEYKSYTKEYWESRTLAPSCLIYYLGINKRLPELLHHNLFFDRSFDVHASEIYERPQFPSDPLFYVCVPSKTDPSVAPEGHENLFILIPTAAGVTDTPEICEDYFQRVIARIEQRCGESIRDSIVVRRDYAHNDFVNDYHSFKGNAYGLANTLRQTAVLKPSIKSKKLSNLFFGGQLTVPGPGVPPSLISGQVVAQEVIKEMN